MMGAGKLFFFLLLGGLSVAKLNIKAPVFNGHLSRPVSSPHPTHVPTHHPSRRPTAKPTNSDLDFLCNLCTEISSCCLSELVSIVENSGASSCADLCGYITNKELSAVCTTICDAVGFIAFETILKQSDLFPIYLCDELRLCKNNTCRNPKCASFQSYSLTPASGKLGTFFKVSAVAVSSGGVGTSEMYLNATGPGNATVSQSVVLPQGFPTAGKYPMPAFGLATSIDSYLYPVGAYHGRLMLCGGDCADLSNRYVFDSKFVQFTITPAESQSTSRKIMGSGL